MPAKAQRPPERIIDLSHPLENGQLTYPGDPRVEIRGHDTIKSAGYNTTRLSMGTHQGTHVDAPRHYFADSAGVDRLRLQRLYGPANLVDLAPRRPLPPRTQITLMMLLKHAWAFQPNARVIYRTGWDRAFGRPEFFTDHPELTVDAARWIVSRRVAMLGTDAASLAIDKCAEVHRILLNRRRPVILVESLANLRRLPKRFTFIGLPLKLVGRDGSPIRAAAIV